MLAEVGGRGQERLLESVVAIHGRGDSALVCANYLAGAGVGTLALSDDVASSSALGRSIGLAARNPDCTVAVGDGAGADVVVVVGALIPASLPPRSTVIWGAARDGGATLAHLPPGRGCVACLAALAASEPESDDPSIVLGTMLALEALRALLALDAGDGARLVRFDLERSGAEVLPFPACPACA